MNGRSGGEQARPVLSQQRRLPTLARPNSVQDAESYLALFCPSLSVHPRFVPAAPLPLPLTALTKIYSLTQHFQRHELRVLLYVRPKHPHICLLSFVPCNHISLLFRFVVSLSVHHQSIPRWKQSVAFYAQNSQVVFASAVRRPTTHCRMHR